MEKIFLIISILIYSTFAHAEIIMDQKCAPNSNICIRVGYTGFNSAEAFIDLSEDRGSTWERVIYCPSPAQGPIIASYFLEVDFKNLSWHASGTSWVGAEETEHLTNMWADSSDGFNWVCEYGD